MVRAPSTGSARRPRRLPSLAALTAVATLLTACGGGGGPASSANATKATEVRLGVILPLTGSTAQNGNNSRQGIELAADLINKAGGIKSMNGAKIKLDIADATSDPAKAASAATDFVSKGEPPLAIVGAYASGLTVTVAQVTERRQVPLLTTAFSDELTTKGYKYLFQLPAKASAVGGAQMAYAIDIAKAAGKDIKRAVIVYANNAYGESQAKGLQAQAQQSGVEVALFESYSPTISDAGPVAEKVLAAKPDAIFSVAYVTDGVLLSRALRSRGSTVPVVGGSVDTSHPTSRRASGTRSTACSASTRATRTSTGTSAKPTNRSTVSRCLRRHTTTRPRSMSSPRPSRRNRPRTPRRWRRPSEARSSTLGRPDRCPAAR